MRSVILPPSVDDVACSQSSCEVMGLIRFGSDLPTEERELDRAGDFPDAEELVPVGSNKAAVNDSESVTPSWPTNFL
jgi:hypothetical protein